MAPSSRKTYVDLILVEAQMVVKKKSTLDPKVLKKPYCLISSLSQDITTSVGSTNNPTWNDDCSFTLDDEFEELLIEIYDNKKKAHKNDQILLGQVILNVKALNSGKTQDLWFDIQPPPTGHSAIIVTGQIHLITYKSKHHNKMMLSDYGSPQKYIPIRINPGDLILVHNTDLITHTVHLSTRSQWDHIAMVVETRAHDQLLLFEATSDGVEAYLLNSALAFYRMHKKIAIRRACFTRTNEFREGLKDFVEEVIGRPYKQDWIQLVRASYNANEEDDLSSLFCSQLIAAAYQRLGLLSTEIFSNNFVPSDFAGNLQGKLTGARMGKLRKIPCSTIRKQVEIKEQYAEEESCGNVNFKVTEDQIHNIKFTDTAMKRDAKLNLYTVYIINVTTYGGYRWMLFKRYNDFVLLDKELHKYFINIPSLPRKYLVAKFDEQTIHRRRVALQHYFKSLVRSPAVFCSILYEFLTTERKGVSVDPSRQIKKKTVKKLKSPKKAPSKEIKRRKRKNTITTEKKDKNLRKSSHVAIKKRTRVHSTPRSNSSQNISRSNWTAVKPSDSSPAVVRKGSVSLTNRSTENAIITNSKWKSPSLNTKQHKTKLTDLSSMFGNRSYVDDSSTNDIDEIDETEVPDTPTRTKREKFRKARLKRSSATFYMKKFKGPKQLPQFEMSDSESGEETNEENETYKSVLKEENITKLSDITNLDLSSLGIDDIDLGEFDIDMNDVSECNINQLLDEVNAI